ncbi:MAG TPA: cyclase family protein [Candidatus Binatus sp.]|nr:cyclase family protein [Candidatus Binatus sp.]
MDFSHLPRYRELPIRAGLPQRSAWGVFGDDDQLGTLNLLTPERTAAAARLVRSGRVFPLALDMDAALGAMGRPPFRHHIEFSQLGADDYYDSLYSQAATCWDSLSRIAHPVRGYYNGCRQEDITGQPGSRNGIDNAARRGIAGRFVLADLGRWRDATIPFDMTASEAVSTTELEACLDAASAEIQPGDILMIRFGWITWFLAGAAPSPSVDRTRTPGTPGLSRDESMAEWLWDHHVAAVVTDTPSLEVVPFGNRTEAGGLLHFRLIPLLGMTLGELFAMDELAADCAADGTYDGLFVAAPINKRGGVGSPGNAIAIK